MVNVDIDPQLYSTLKQIVASNRLEYPSIKFFVQKVLLDKLARANPEQVYEKTD